MVKPAVIVVNSLVARGAVGGRAGVFALERLGFPVWSVPTVVLPWHPGHGRASRIVAPPEAFAALLADLAASPKLGEVGAILSGYLGDAGQARALSGLVAAVKAANPGARFLCDPVIGDGGRLFQPPALAAAIRDELLPLADIATPNRFELLWLTDAAAGGDARDNAGLVDAARRLGPAEVVVTSAFAPEGAIGMLAIEPGTTLLATHEALPAVPNGTGDLFAALYLGRRLAGAVMADALAKAAAATLAVCRRAAAARADELPLAAAQDLLVRPPDDAGVVVSGLAGATP